MSSLTLNTSQRQIVVDNEAILHEWGHDDFGKSSKIWSEDHCNMWIYFPCYRFTISFNKQLHAIFICCGHCGCLQEEINQRSPIQLKAISLYGKWHKSWWFGKWDPGLEVDTLSGKQSASPLGAIVPQYISNSGLLVVDTQFWWYWCIGHFCKTSQKCQISRKTYPEAIGKVLPLRSVGRL